MEYVKGDIIDMAFAGELAAVVHGCNCFNTMGAGFAAQIKKRCPEAFRADTEMVENYPLDVRWRMLGGRSEALVPRGDGTTFHVINAYTQYKPGANFEYAALDCFLNNGGLYIFGTSDMCHGNWRIGFPLIGCGIGGGDWKVVERMLEEAERSWKSIYKRAAGFVVVEYEAPRKDPYDYRTHQ
jgi:O-acetyl-ADP-ribose deacetylase (regulator of RNase III)